MNAAPLLASLADRFSNPLFGAVLICWIFSVCIHEYAHALVAYWGGDKSVKEKGYLSFDMLSYIHPVTTLLIPLIFLAMGGIPLPGGAVYIEHHRLRGNRWRSYVAAAGPASNFILFLICAAVIHPSVGLVDAGDPNLPTWARLIGAMAVLQLIAVFFNLIPIPPLDGYHIIEPHLDHEMRDRLSSLGWGGLIAIFFAFRFIPGFARGFFNLVAMVMRQFGLPPELTWFQYDLAFFPET
jgi:Zn-dependent protease